MAQRRKGAKARGIMKKRGRMGEGEKLENIYSV